MQFNKPAVQMRFSDLSFVVPLSGTTNERRRREISGNILAYDVNKIKRHMDGRSCAIHRAREWGKAYINCSSPLLEKCKLHFVESSQVVIEFKFTATSSR